MSAEMALWTVEEEWNGSESRCQVSGGSGPRSCVSGASCWHWRMILANSAKESHEGSMLRIIRVSCASGSGGVSARLRP